MTPSLAGQITVVVLILGFAMREIFLVLRDARSRQKIASQEDLKAMIDQFTGQYGQRDEDDDVVQERRA